MQGVSSEALHGFFGIFAMLKNCKQVHVAGILSGLKKEAGPALELLDEFSTYMV